MSAPTPASRALARRLIEHEAGGTASAAGLTGAAERTFGRLRRSVGRLVGAGGLDALERRAVDLAVAEHPYLEGLAAAPAAPEAEGDAAFRSGDPDEVRAALEALLARFLDLLSTFLGEDMRSRLVHQAWPELPVDDPSDGPGEMR